MRRFAVLCIAVLLGGCASQPGRSLDDRQQQQQVVTRAQAIAKVHTELAASYYERTQYGVALEELDIAMRVEPDYAPAYSVRGLVHMALREDKEADEDFQHSLRLDPDNSDTHNNYGWFLCQRGHEHESIKHFLAALKNPLYTTPEKAYLNAGVCSKKAGEMKDAEAYLQKALIVQPNMPESLVALADLSFANGDYAGAKSYFMRFEQVVTVPLTAENLWLAVRIERKLGDQNSEASYAMQLNKRYPDSRETQLMLYGK